MPHRLSFITGLTMSFLFICNALATTATGILADTYGLAQVLAAATGLLAVAFVFSLLVPARMALYQLRRSSHRGFHRIRYTRPLDRSGDPLNG